jgi:hypothetical protein
MKLKFIMVTMVLGFITTFLTNCKDDDVVSPITITSVSPEEGHVGDVVTISGTNFNSGNDVVEVYFNTTPAIITSATDNEIQVTIPANATTGEITITVNNRSASSPNDFTVLQPPSITSFTPQSGGVGSAVTITGLNFSAIVDENSITFNGTTATVTASSATQLTVTVPQGAGTGKISVTVKGKSFTTTEDFTIVPTNEWLSAADFTGAGRYYATGFAIGSKGYVGTGRKNGGGKAKDLWEYNTETNVWTQKADIPAVARESAVGFSIGTKGYVGTGFTGQKLEDIWEYDPQQNQWAPKDNFGGGNRQNAFVFVVGSKAYVGSGIHNDQHERMRDLWEFDPAAAAGQQWIQKQSIGDANYVDNISGLPSAAFSLGGKGYVAIPLSNGTMPDFWEFTPASNTWTPKGKTPVDILSSSQSVTFVMQTKGYLLSGAALWRYDAEANTWLQKASFPLSNIRYATGFSNGALGFAGIGYTTAESLKFYKYYPD